MIKPTCGEFRVIGAACSSTSHPWITFLRSEQSEFLRYLVMIMQIDNKKDTKVYRNEFYKVICVSDNIVCSFPLTCLYPLDKVIFE
jgi:hypothetical protein